MGNFSFHVPTKLVFGKGVFGEVGGELRAAGMKKVLLLAGGGSIRANGVYEQVTVSMREAGVKWAEVWGVQPNPLITKVDEAVAVAKREKAQAILSVGGGSVLDSAKAAAAGYHMKRSWDAFENPADITRALPVFAVLTLSATGSEMNPFAVVTNAEQKKKWAIAAPVLYPRVSFLDPAVQASLPWRQTACGAVDALSHIMEYYSMGREQDTAVSLNSALSGAVIRATDTLARKPRDYSARANLAWAATLALNGISGAMLDGGEWSVHTMEHAVSALHPEVAHAEGLAVLFPAWILYVAKSNPETFRRWAKEVWGASTVEAGVAKWRSKLRAWKMPVTLAGLGIAEREIPAIAANAMLKGPFGVLRKMQKRDVQSVLRLAL
jgi:hypothetical protein